MKLDLLEKLKTVRGSTLEPGRIRVRYTEEDHPTNSHKSTEESLYKFTTFVEMGHQAIGQAEQAHEIHQRATREIMQMVYGPVTEELVILANELIKMGIPHRDLEHLWGIIDTLRGV